jgi:hypothetical protein
MTLRRRDFPPNVPADTIDRVLAVQENMKRNSRIATGAIVIIGVGGSALMIGAAVMGLSSIWLPGIVLLVSGAMPSVARWFAGHHAQNAIVEMGRACPKCHKPMFTDTWSMAEQKAQREAVMQGYCPRCFEHVGPNVMPYVEEAIQRRHPG